MVCPVKIDSVRPLVRYVDDRQAVIDTHILTHATLPADEAHRTADAPIAYVMAEIDGADGFHDEGCGRLLLKPTGSSMEGGFRFDIDEPQRWLESASHIKPDRRQYAACTQHMDHAIGRMIEASRSRPVFNSGGSCFRGVARLGASFGIGCKSDGFELMVPCRDSL